MIEPLPSDILTTAPVQVIATADPSPSSGTEQSLLSVMEAYSAGISPTASVLSHLEGLQQGDPAEFSKVESSVATQLHDDAIRAQFAGETTQANTLNLVAELFEASAESGLVPTLDALHEAGLSQDHNHGHDAAQIDSTTIPAPAPLPATDSIEVILAGAVSKAIDS
jgi:hypothetical protein